jgi:uncharacterized protein (DUF433 family)
MAEGIDSSMLAAIKRYQSGAMRSEMPIQDYLNGTGSALEAFVASLFDAAKAQGGPGIVIPELLMQTLARQPQDEISLEAWHLLKRESEAYGEFLQLTNNVEMSLKDHMRVFQAYVAPAVQRIGDWVIDRLIYPEPDEAAIEINDGVPYIRGTRMKIRLIAEELRNGAGPVQIMEAHPHLTLDQIRAAIGYYRAHTQEIDAQIAELHRSREANRRPSSAPSREQLRERMKQQGWVMTPNGLKKTA